MVLQELAQKLLDDGAPISVSRMATRYQFTVLRAKGLENEQIAQELNISNDIIEEVEESLEEEFLYETPTI